MSEERDPATDQPLPIPTDEISVHDLVVEDVKQRKALGLRKYKSLLQASNGRDHLLDAYEEALDLAIYLRAELDRRAVMANAVQTFHREASDES